MKLKLVPLFAMLLLVSCAEKSLNEEGVKPGDQTAGAAEIDQKAGDTESADNDGTDGGANKEKAEKAPSPNGSKNVPDGQMEVFYKRFNDARAHHDTETANHLAGEILTHNPNDAKVLNGLTAMAIEDGKVDLARLLIRKVLEKNPNNGGAYNNLGVVELKDDNLRLALIQFKKATELDPGNRAAHANLGAIYLKYRNYQNATVELTAAQSHGDDSLSTLNNLAYALKGSGNYDDAAKYYQKALTKDQNNVTVMINYATLLVENLNKPKDAVKLLNKIRFISQEPAILNKVDWLSRRAENPKSKTGSAAKGAEKGVSE
jgi:Flp pilus assembly protein TadD